MKKPVLLLLLFVVPFLVGCPELFDKERPIRFEDENLEAAVREAINKPEGPIYKGDVQNLTELDARGKGIESLEGIQHLKSLQILNLNRDTNAETYNYISDITPLSNLTNLVELMFWANSVSDISPLANLANLKRLNFPQNSVSDISPLAGLTNLEILEFGVNSVNDISPLAGLTNLKMLFIGGNSVSDISPLAGLANLERLSFWSNSVSDISPLAGLTNLKRLWFSTNLVSDISSLANLTNLEWLRFSENLVTDISALVDNEGIGSGDYVEMTNNYLDLTPGSQNMDDIQTLLDRGVEVDYEPQRTYEPPTVTKMSGPEGTISQSSSTFEWQGTDGDGEIVLYEYRKDGGDWIDHGLKTSYTWEGYSEGAHEFEVRARDNNAMWSEPLLWSFAYQKTEEEIIQLYFWYSQTGIYSQAIIDICEEFNKLHEGRILITPVYNGNYDQVVEKLLTETDPENLPHLFQMEQSRAGQFVDVGIVQFIEPLIDDDPEFKAQMDDFFPRLLDNTVYYGKLHGFPLNNSTPILYYNKDLYERAGLDPDEPPATWDDLVYNALEISALGPDIFGFRVDSSDWLIEMYIWQANGEVISEDGKTILFGSPEAIAAAQFFQDLIEEETVIMTITGGNSLDMSGNIGMMIRSAGTLSYLIENASFEVGATTVPPKIRGDVPISGGNLYMVAGKTNAETQAAWEFMKFFVEPEVSLEYALSTGYLTPRISAYNASEMQELMESDPRFRHTYTHLETVARSRPFHGPYREVCDLLKEAWEKVLTNTDADVTEEFENTAKLAQTVLDNYWQDF